MDYEGLSKDLTDQSKVIGSSGKGWGKFAGTNQKAATAIIDLLSRAEVAEARCKAFEKMVREYRDEIVPRYMEMAEKAERERDEAVRICAKLIALCSPPKEWVPKLFQRKINRPGDYMGCGYTFLDGFNLIIENFVETADDELYTAIRDATEKEIIERSMRMSGKKEE